MSQPVRLSPASSGYLDVIRSLAAFAVMLGHCRALFFVDYAHIDTGLATPLIKVLYVVTGFGTQSVMIFFVLSGFLISSSIFRGLGRSSWSWRDYALDRACRLYMVLIPGLLLGLLWDWLGIHFFNESGTYSGPIVGFGENVPQINLAMKAFIGNLLFLQNRFTPTFGSNRPLWSLFNEGWYYVLFPALVSAVMALRRRAVVALICSLLLAVLAAWVLQYQLLGFVVWLSGSVVALTAPRLEFRNHALWLAYTLLAGGLFVTSIAASRSGVAVFGSELVVGVTFALLLHGIVQINIPVGEALLAIARTFAGFSYSLYVLHFPLLLFIRAILIPGTRWQPSALGYGVVIAAAVTLYAFLIAQVTEGKTSVVRNYFRRRPVNVSTIDVRS